MLARWIITLAESDKPVCCAINKMGMRQREIIIIPLGECSAVTILKYKDGAYTYKF